MHGRLGPARWRPRSSRRSPPRWTPRTGAGWCTATSSPPTSCWATPTAGAHAYLTDFGLSRFTDSEQITRTGTVVGTLDYMAPEQLEGRKVDGRVDVYALGCVLYQALTGRVPYPRDTEHAKMWAHMTEPPPRPGAVAPDLPPGFDEVSPARWPRSRTTATRPPVELGAAAVAAAQQALGRPWGGDRTIDMPRQASAPATEAAPSGPQWSGARPDGRAPPCPQRCRDTRPLPRRSPPRQSLPHRPLPRRSGRTRPATGTRRTRRTGPTASPVPSGVARNGEGRSGAAEHGAGASGTGARGTAIPAGPRPGRSGARSRSSAAGRAVTRRPWRPPTRPNPRTRPDRRRTRRGRSRRRRATTGGRSR